MRRRGSRMTGKNDPFRSFGIRSSTSPAWVANNRSRAPLRSVVLVLVRSYFPAPTRSVASASINSCMTIRTDSRTRSTPSPARNASSSSDTADWDKAIGGDSFFGEYLAVHTENHADGPLIPGAAPYPQTPPRHGTPTQRLSIAASPCRLAAGVSTNGVSGALVEGVVSDRRESGFVRSGRPARLGRGPGRGSRSASEDAGG